MKTFIIDEQTEIVNGTSSKGCQNKWKIDNFYVKQDTLGYEGLVEYVSSFILTHTNLNSVRYQLCNIRYENSDDIHLGCYSENFLNTGENLITLRRLSEIYHFPFNKAYDRLSSINKIKYVLDNVKNITRLSEFELYLSNLLYIDKVLLNEDRHFNNIAFIYSEANNEYSLVPIFDNGAGLLSDTKLDYPLHYPYFSYLKRVKSKPFVSDFNRQTQDMDKICKSSVEFYSLNFKDIENLVSSTPYSDDIKSRVIRILRHQFIRYNISCINTTNLESSTQITGNMQANRF